MRRYLVSFFHTEQAGSFVMLLAAAMALLAANSGLSGWYELQAAQWHTGINDMGMVLFFLLIGMELKREMLDGVLSRRDQIALPFAAALGGMMAPAAIFLLVNYQTPEHWQGWAIASATDIAFAICILMLIAKTVPPALKVFLLAIAVFDDLGAIMIIALFYSKSLVILPLLCALCIIGLLVLCAYRRVGILPPYILLGIALWFALHAAGLHTTLAGVITGLAIPPKRLHRAIAWLHPWVAFGILPCFAFVTAGVPLSGVTFAMVLNPLPLGICLGLLIGKPLGIMGMTYGLVRCGWVAPPEGASWRNIWAVSLLAGIGFTMSLFIGILAFPDPALQNQVKIGVMLGSCLASLLAWICWDRSQR